MSRLFQHFAFEDPWWLLLFLLLIPLLFLSRRPGASSSIGFSSLSILGSVGQRTNQRTGNDEPVVIDDKASHRSGQT